MQLNPRFIGDLARIWPEGTRDPALKLGIAVSGGPDSLALLLMAAAARPDTVCAATVDHGLRPESAAEAADVARVCTKLGVPHRILRVDVVDGNVQAQARAARYAALAAWMEAESVAALATAHHADDQAETLVMRLNRASGVAGLAGVRERSWVPDADHLLIRPVLGWRRAELAEMVAQAGLVAADDPSNRNEAFDRVRVRQALASADWLDVGAWARAAGHIAEADDALDWAAGREYGARVLREGMGVTYRPAAPRAIALRVLARIIEDMDGEAARGEAVARLYDTLLARQPMSIGGLVARPGPQGWVLMKAPKRRA
ncbi:tRNA lysidine(34) synthetase TilS [Novosphingobium sp. UBA1939]|uniref:tRNA lysidine(34) synthetase TilS n=1 Tax=Novosphingobium sp. UBA1939 TaxID=1946982 RepID=UPI0025F7F324|nr:tRNA lysidine(34) synthetase TilS [Novosphingobium sp. UBA1939]